jgi:hypothetical protein
MDGIPGLALASVNAYGVFSLCKNNLIEKRSKIISVFKA